MKYERINNMYDPIVYYTWQLYQGRYYRIINTYDIVTKYTTSKFDIPLPYKIIKK